MLIVGVAWKTGIADATSGSSGKTMLGILGSSGTTIVGIGGIGEDFVLNEGQDIAEWLSTTFENAEGGNEEGGEVEAMETDS